MADTKRVVAIVGGGCGVLLLAFCCFAAAGMYYCKSSWDETDAAAQEFLRMLREGEVRQAYDRMSESYRRETSFEGFEAQLEANPALTEHGDAAVTQHEFQPGVAVVGGALFTNDGPVPFQMAIVDAGGAWRVDSLTVGAPSPEPTAPSPGPGTDPDAPRPPPLPDSLKGDAN